MFLPPWSIAISINNACRISLPNLDFLPSFRISFGVWFYFVVHLSLKLYIASLKSFCISPALFHVLKRPRDFL
jgi:hypothetical protein